jgi:hypothetical protein
MIKPAYQKHCHITKKWDLYTFENFRDFSRTSEDVDQIQNRITETINITKIVGIDMYICPFALRNMIGHTMISFRCSDGKKICLSVEAEIKLHKQYSIAHWLFWGYRSRYIRGTERDILNLRIFRNEKVYKYPIHISKQHIKELFLDITRESNRTESWYINYNLFSNNCTSWLWEIARRHFKIEKRHYSLLINSLLPKYLHKLGVVKISEKTAFHKIEY